MNELRDLSQSSNRAALTRLMMKTLQAKNPEEYNRCISLIEPKIKDKSLIPSIIELAAMDHRIGFENNDFIIAICYYLTAPYKLYHKDLKLEVGVRDLMNKAMGFANPEMISYYSDGIIVRYKNPRFAAKVQELGDLIYEVLKEFDL